MSRDDIIRELGAAITGIDEVLEDADEETARETLEEVRAHLRSIVIRLEPPDAGPAAGGEGGGD